MLPTCQKSELKNSVVEYWLQKQQLNTSETTEIRKSEFLNRTIDVDESQWLQSKRKQPLIPRRVCGNRPCETQKPERLVEMPVQQIAKGQTASNVGKTDILDPIATVTQI